MGTTKNKIWIGWLALLFIVVHFGLIISYALPAKFSSTKLRSVAIPYVEPVFTQRWSMFAPCPIIDATVEVKFYFENDSTSWISPTENARKKHSWYRGTYHGELVLAESNLMYWLGLDLDAMGVKTGDSFPIERTSEFHKGYSYFKIKDYISGNARYLYGVNPTKGLIRCYIENVVTKETGVIVLPPFYY
mgnify:CR=1 FL=1